MVIKQICVFCGSGKGADPLYLQTAEQLGQALAMNNLGLVYGGTNMGLMGQVAKGVQKANGHVTGIITEGLKSISLPNINELKIVDDIQKRKEVMIDISDGFIALPGGLGTLDEIFDVLTLKQLGIISKPCGILNVNGFYDGLFDFLDSVIEERFMDKTHKSMLIVDDNPDSLISKLLLNEQSFFEDKVSWLRKENN